MSELRSDSLKGRRLLVVEDEYVVAMDLALTLEEQGAEIIGPVGSVREGLELIEAHRSRIDGAVLDLNLRGERTYPLADVLRERGIPFVFATGYDGWIIPEEYRDVPKCEKPIDPQELIRYLALAPAGK